MGLNGVLLGLMIASGGWGQTHTTAVRPDAPGELQAATAAEVESMRRLLADWGQLQHYRTANAELQPAAEGEARVVFSVRR